MKVSLPCLPSFHVYIGNPDKKLKAMQGNLADIAQEGEGGPRKVLPGIYAGEKSRAHTIRKELVELERQKKNKAAATIQAYGRGYIVRSEAAASAQQQTPPYTSQIQLQQATYGFSPKSCKNRLIGAKWRKAEFDYYSSTKNIPSWTPAFLYSSQRMPDLDSVMAAYKAPPKKANKGHIYYNSPVHNMRVNSYWLLGLAHHQREVALTTPLDDETLVRKSAKNKPVEARNTEHKLSALGREVLGMVQNGYFVPSYNSSLEIQILKPTPQAQFAKLEDFKTPLGMKKEEIKERLAAKGIDVSGITLGAAVKQDEHGKNQDRMRGGSGIASAVEENWLPSSSGEEIWV